MTSSPASRWISVWAATAVSPGADARRHEQRHRGQPARNAARSRRSRGRTGRRSPPRATAEPLPADEEQRRGRADHGPDAADRPEEPDAALAEPEEVDREHGVEDVEGADRNVAHVAIATTDGSRASARIAANPAASSANRLPRSTVSAALRDRAGRVRTRGGRPGEGDHRDREAPDEVARRRRGEDRPGPPSAIRSPAPSGPSSDPLLSAMPDTTLAAVSSSGEVDDLGQQRRVDGPREGDRVAVSVARA